MDPQLNSALMDSITSMSEYFVAANTRTSFTDLAESVSNPLGPLANDISSSNLNLANIHNTVGQTNQSLANVVNISSASNSHKQQHNTNNNCSSSITNQSSANHHQLTGQLHIGSNHHERNSSPLPMQHSSASFCNQNHQHSHNNSSSSNNNNHHHHHHNHTSHQSHSSCNISTSRYSQPARTQIPIHCYIEQLDACADIPSYQMSLSDNDLFNTTNPTDTIKSISNQTSCSTSTSNKNPPHLHQSKLALESVTNGTTGSLSSLANNSASTFYDCNPSDCNDNNDLDGVGANLDLDSLAPDSPLAINPPDLISTSNTLTSGANNNIIQQTCSSICNEPLDNRQSSPYYDNSPQFHSCKETYVIVTSNVLYIDLVRTVLLQLGYSAMDLINAKATIQIKNWKPLALDQVTEDKGATVGEVLGDISTFVTLRIRLYSSITKVPTEWTETMIRQVVLALTQTMSQLTLSKLCNISQPLISSIVRGGKRLGRRKCAEFGQWYMNYIKSADARPSTMFCEGGGARLVFDKTREIPRLKGWFANSTKPSDELLEEYSKILNEDALRKDRPQVTAKALKNWWKNERQKLGIRQRETRGRPKLKRID